MRDDVLSRASSAGMVGAGESVVITTESPTTRSVFHAQLPPTPAAQSSVNDRTTSSAVIFVPSWKRTPGRSQNCQRCA